ncbi:uncharacterized protein LOC141907580 [Tubulanus polymorphus]|uniref:uncharacterized protein LOC141907580 n=1 Tax=Tubulanus polymorphus TaxID=672921 RepID=UPI003DA28DBB
MCLPLLPAESIAEGLQSIKRDTPEVVRRQLNQFFTYLERYWINRIGVNRLSVNGCTERTNNGVESFHATLRKKLGIHPNLFVHLDNLKKIALDSENETSRLQRGLEIRRRRKRKVVLTDNVIKLCAQRLSSGHYTIVEFLNATRHAFGGYANPDNWLQDINSDNENDDGDNEFNESVHDDSGDDDLDDEDLPELAEEPIAEDPPRANEPAEPVINEELMCVICLTEPRERVALVPCGHMLFCSVCVDRLIEIRGAICPVCRSEIMMKINLYQ